MRSIPGRLVAGAKRLPNDVSNGFFQACGGLIGLVVSDNLLGFTKTPYSNQIAVGIAVVVALVGFFSRNRRWGFGYRKKVLKTVFWMFGAMGLIILGIAAEKQLGVFSGLTLSVFNFWVAIFLIAGIALTTPFFILADWARDSEKYVEHRFKRREHVPTIFNAEFIVDD